MQRRGIHTSVTIELLWQTVYAPETVGLQQWKRGYFYVSVPRTYLEDNLSVESQPVKRRPGGWCETAVSLGVTQLSFVS
jgi:hypothetical protein